MKQVFAIEGLDRLGKSSLIDGIQDRLGFYQTIHFSKPTRLAAYLNAPVAGVPSMSSQVYHYQQESFRNSMIMVKSGARIIFDRWHLGEFVYAPMYRAYSGEYVFDFEKNHDLDTCDIRLILLTENFKVSRHFVDDGKSLGTEAERQEEQSAFVQAFSRSIIRDKKMICVTSASGSFRPKEEILEEALS